MSYCVNCGVQLAPSEKVCPLCGTPVFNPRNPNPKSDYHPHADRVEKILQNADRRYAVILATIFLMVPVVLSLIIDWVGSGTLTWSGYVACSAVFVFIVALLPIWMKKPSALLCIFIDSVALIWFLHALQSSTGGTWFNDFGLPIAISVCAAAMVYAALSPYTRYGLLGNIACVLLLCSALIISLEIIIDLALSGNILLGWSIIAATPCLMLGIASIVLQRRQNLKDKIRRKLFF